MPRPKTAAKRGKMILETPRLILRPFAPDDLGHMAELMANKDFMRFSMGPMTQEQTKSFLDKVIGWDRERMPSQFHDCAIERNACGLLRLFSPRSRWQNGN
jgi:RimJ/RimL family protein N-acetyltransferase